MTEISNGESGLSVREKLNQLFTLVEQTQENRIITLENAPSVSFISRGALVSAVALGTTWADGTVISDGTVFYKAVAGSTVISDLPGLMPFCPVGWCSASPEHFQEHTTPGTTDMSAAVQAAVDSLEAVGPFSVGGVVVFGRGVYRVENVRVQTNGITFRGQGRNATELRNTSQTLPTLHFEAADSLTSTVERCAVEDLLFFNTSSNPTTSAHIKAVRAKITIKGCEINNAFRGVEIYGSPQGFRILDTDITQGANTGGGLQSGSCAVALFRAEVAAPTTVAPGIAYSDPAQPSPVVDVWDASSGTFPAGASDTETYRVSVAGTTGGVTFAVGDYLQAITASPSTTVYAGNWEKTAVLGYYTEPNVVQIDNCDFESNTNGMDAVLILTCGDGVQVTNCHLGFAVNSIVEMSPRQKLIDFTSIQFSNVFFDPRIGVTNHCVWIRDRYGVGSSTLGGIRMSGCIFGSPDEDGVRVDFDVDRLMIESNIFKNCGHHGVYVGDANVDQLVITGNTFFNTNAALVNAASVYVANVGSTLIDANMFRTGYIGIQVAAVDRVVIGEANVFENMANRSMLFATGMPDDIIVPQRARLASGAADAASQSSAATLNVPVGRDFVTVTGTSTVGAIRSTSPNHSIHGREVLLTFTGSLTVTHTASGSATAGDIVLMAGTDLSATAGTFLRLRCISGVWYEAP